MKKWNYYTTNELKPRGWLKRQLEIQANGLCGNLDKVWRDVRDSAWIGGDADGWERVPYWLDGFIPMAYLLEDADLIARAKKYMDAIMDAQQPDGWLCPCPIEKRATYDTWTVLLIAKVLVVYYDCARDERAVDVLYRMMRNFHDLLADGSIKLFDWGKYRWFEGFISLEFLQERFDEPWIKNLAQILQDQGMDYKTVEHLWVRPLNKWTFDTHIVNLTMMLKYEAVSHGLLGLPYTDDAERMIGILNKYNGMPAGTIAGDECLAGLSPIHGAELCSVVELMYTYELLYAHTGENKWLERLEVLAFNALPAANSDDMWTHQYDQMSNQIACIRFPGKTLFRTNSSEAHLFGLEPEFGCCTANFGQGWPKFALSAFTYSGGVIQSTVPVPSELNCDTARIVLETNYPFENTFTYTVEAKKDFTFVVRIPSFAQNIRVGGEPAPACNQAFSCKAGETYRFDISYDTVPHFEARPYDLAVAKCGSLLFALPIGYTTRMREYEKNGVERKFPYCDYEYVPTTDWSYAYCGEPLTIQQKEVSDVPFSSQNPPVVLETDVVPIDWGFEDGYDTVCAKVPDSRAPIGEPKKVALYPYGCAKLRMTELPIVE